MNNDLVLSKEWSKPFESIIEGTDELKKLGCLGNIQTDPVSNKIDHAGVVFKSGTPEHFLRGKIVNLRKDILSSLRSPVLVL